MKRLIIYLALLIALPIGVKAQIDYPIGHPVFHDDSAYATKGDVRIIVRYLYDSLIANSKMKGVRVEDVGVKSYIRGDSIIVETLGTNLSYLYRDSIIVSHKGSLYGDIICTIPRPSWLSVNDSPNTYKKTKIVLDHKGQIWTNGDSLILICKHPFSDKEIICLLQERDSLILDSLKRELEERKFGNISFWLRWIIFLFAGMGVGWLVRWLVRWIIEWRRLWKS